MRSPGQLLTREQLIDRVWGADSEVEPRALDAQIARSRKALEPTAGSPRHLTTVRGLGYGYGP